MFSIASSLAVVALALWVQDPPQPAPPQNPQPAQIQFPGGQAAPARPDEPVQIKTYRGVDRVDYVRKLEEVRELDLDRVDWDAGVVARLDGKDITRDDYMLWLAFTSGQSGVKAMQLKVLSEQMLAKIMADGGTADAYKIAPEDVDARLRSEEEQMRANGEQALADYQKMIDETMGGGRYRKLIEANLLSERLLLPPIKKLEAGVEPQALPVEAAELLTGDQANIRAHIAEQYEKGNEFPPMFRNTFLMILQDALIGKSDIRYAIEEPLAPGVYMTINGQPVTTASILDFVPDAPDSRELALRMLLLYRSIDNELERRNAKLTNEEFQLRFEAEEAEYRGTLFPLPNLIRLRGFFTIPEYREYDRRRIGFQNSVVDQVTEADLTNHHATFGKLFYENGKLTIDTLWSGLTQAEATTGGDLLKAWAAAREKAEKMLVELKSGRPIAEVRTSLGDIYPIEPSGTLVGKTRNELRNYLGETEYTIFVNGYSLADDLFYNRVEGEVVGPVKVNRTMLAGMRSRMGYALAQIVDFKKNSALKSFEQQRAMVEQDYLDLQFIYFGHECLKQAKIELTLRS